MLRRWQIRSGCSSSRLRTMRWFLGSICWGVDGGVMDRWVDANLPILGLHDGLFDRSSSSSRVGWGGSWDGWSLAVNIYPLTGLGWLWLFSSSLSCLLFLSSELLPILLVIRNPLRLLPSYCMYLHTVLLSLPPSSCLVSSSKYMCIYTPYTQSSGLGT